MRRSFREEHCASYSEQVVWLPDCYLVNDDKRAISERTPSRSECGLPEDAFVFCCFNNAYKLGPGDVRGLDAASANATPDSVLWLSEGNATAQANLRREASEPRRRGRSADLCAAPAGCGRPSGAAAAGGPVPRYACPITPTPRPAMRLWAGVPLVTCLGTTFVGRVAASLLKAVGLDELVTQSLDDYEALALKLAQ